MNDVLAQATALRSLIQSFPHETSREALGEALIVCSGALVDAGEPQLALGLLQDGRKLTAEMTPEWALRLGAVQAQALLRSGKPEEAHSLVRDLKSRYGCTIPH